MHSCSILHHIPCNNANKKIHIVESFCIMSRAYQYHTHKRLINPFLIILSHPNYLKKLNIPQRKPKKERKKKEIYIEKLRLPPKDQRTDRGSGSYSFLFFLFLHIFVSVIDVAVGLERAFFWS